MKSVTEIDLIGKGPSGSHTMGPEKAAGLLAKLYSISDYPARKTMDAARRFRPEFCAKAAELVLEPDYRMKTSFDDPELLLELLILQLAQEARRG